MNLYVCLLRVSTSVPLISVARRLSMPQTATATPLAARPPIDLDLPPRIETATFALG